MNNTFENNTEEVIFSETESIDSQEAITTFEKLLEAEIKPKQTEKQEQEEQPQIRKRDGKKKKQLCTGCARDRFYTLASRELRICINCVKIQQSVQTLVTKNLGHLDVIHDGDDRALFEITCMRGH
jgi:hypothetical protein